MGNKEGGSWRDGSDFSLMVFFSPAFSLLLVILPASFFLEATGGSISFLFPSSSVIVAPTVFPFFFNLLVLFLGGDATNSVSTPLACSTAFSVTSSAISSCTVEGATSWTSSSEITILSSPAKNLYKFSSSLDRLGSRSPPFSAGIST
ncbi:hypothetical protein Dimus_038001 [Dionaea muscipula]